MLEELDLAVTIVGDVFGVFQAIVRFLMSSAVVALDFLTFGGGPAGLFGDESEAVVEDVDVVLFDAADDAVVDVDVVPVLDFQRSRMAFLSSLVVDDDVVDDVAVLVAEVDVVPERADAVAVTVTLGVVEDAVEYLLYAVVVVVLEVAVEVAVAVVVLAVVADVPVVLELAFWAFCILSSASFFCQSFIAADCDIF